MRPCIDAYYVLLIREGWQTQPDRLTVAIPLTATLICPDVAGIAILLTAHEELRQT